MAVTGTFYTSRGFEEQNIVTVAAYQPGIQIKAAVNMSPSGRKVQETTDTLLLHNQWSRVSLQQLQASA